LAVRKFDHVSKRLGIKEGETTDAAVFLTEVEGLSHNAPAMQVNTPNTTIDFEKWIKSSRN
jgi:hypothetical protein